MVNARPVHTSTCNTWADYPVLILVLAVLVISIKPLPGNADILRWDNRQPIPGTQGILPGPGIQLEGQDLPFADFQRADLASANFRSANLQDARLRSSTLTDADLSGANLTSADLVTANLARADLSAANLTGAFTQWTNFSDASLVAADLTGAQFLSSTFANADLTNAIIAGADLQSVTSGGLTDNQLYSTASYQRQNLQAIGLADNNLTGWNFAQQNLTDAIFRRSTLADADLTGAIVYGTQFGDVTARGFKKEQLYSTASYQAKNLQEIGLDNNDLSDWDFRGQNLTGAVMANSTLTRADFTGATIAGADFGNSGVGALTEDQLRSTRSFQIGDLQSIGFKESNLERWNLRGLNLTDASFSKATMRNVDLRKANLTAANFFLAVMSGADLRNANLTDSSLDYTKLNNSNLAGADLTNADLNFATLAGATFSGATVRWANLSGTTPNGFSKRQLYSTASYREKDLTGIQFGLVGFNLTDDLEGWDFRGQNLAVADLSSATMGSADFRQSNLRSVNFSSARDLNSAAFDTLTIYNQWTVFPGDFDPSAAGLTFQRSAPGDLDGDGALNMTDVEMLSEKIRNSRRFSWLNDAFDFNSDAEVDREDLTIWVRDLKQTWFGDANLDGQFDSADLVLVFAAGLYEDSMTDRAKWADGDWNADGKFNSSDLVAAFSGGGYEQGPRPAARAVPEPSGIALLMIACVAIGSHRLSAASLPNGLRCDRARPLRTH